MKDNTRTPKALYADDEPGQRRLVQIILQRMGWQNRLASNGLEAIRIAGQEPLDLILMDLRMPQMDGFQAVRQLRQQGISIPIVAITALEYPRLAEDCQAAGYSGWMVKPITIRGLELVLESTLATVPPC